MKNFKKYSMEELAELLGVSPSEALISNLKAKMRYEIQELVKETELTHQQISDLSGIPRSSVTGIISGSVLKVSIERMLRIAGALGKKVEFSLTDAA